MITSHQYHIHGELKFNIPHRCPECEGSKLLFDYTLQNTGPAVQGRLVTTDITPLVCLGCEECSATVATFRLEELLTVAQGLFDWVRGI